MQRRTNQESPPEKILHTAFECLCARGYANVSMRDIADEAGVALSQVTYYYKSKEKLFLEVIGMMMRRYLHEIEAKLARAADAEEKFAAFTEFFKELVRDNPKLLRLFIDFTAQALWIPSFREQLDKLFGRLAELIEGSLAIDTQVDDRYRGHSPQSVAKLILGALFGTSIQLMLNSGGEVSFESLTLAESLLNG